MPGSGDRKDKGGRWGGGGEGGLLEHSRDLYYYPPFTDEEPKAKGSGDSPKVMVGLGFNPVGWVPQSTWPPCLSELPVQQK